ncbi:serine/threonine-protein phosphatase [Streptomyces sp. PTM05]|uniref:Serine/threonine-protein phosphatase n=1 Tax=Streptantibioticus parmotrematis TaxID=2873249 RepID=A0ABS7QXK3_9ACTN|nr:PP2C family protein-serine/threonine phosphatase [Streptantibioticus parmotrematis]MBY8887936.1 serine/threonine-protein phosphatase [Streptantibioticus parmotrematis]
MRTSGFRRALDALGRGVSTHQGMTIPLTAVFAVVAADLLAGRNHFLAPMMVMVPALAVATTTWRRTLLVGLIGAVAQAALIPYDGSWSHHDRRILGGITISYLIVVLFSAYGAWWREERTAQFRAVVSVAEAAQRALLRPPGPRVGGVRLAVRYASAADAAQIGGDLYAVLDTPHGVRALVGDVRGKGLEAVQTSAVVMGAFREAAYDEGGLAKVAERVDASVRRHVTDGEFTTALFLEFPASREAVPGGGSADGEVFADAALDSDVVLLHYGHVPPLRVSADGTVRSLDPPDPWVPLGLTSFVPGAPTPWRVPLGADEVLVLCTDGVIEARAAKGGGFYPLAERAGPLLVNAAGDLEAAVERLYADLLAHTGGTLGDDSVLLLLARPGV